MRSYTTRSGAGVPSIRVLHTSRGLWEVSLPRRHGVMCATLDEARRLAELELRHTEPCELVVRDAYNRVIAHEIFDGRMPPAPYRVRPSSQPPPGGR